MKIQISVGSREWHCGIVIKSRDRLKAYRYRLEYAGCALLAFLIPKLSRESCVALGQVLGAAAYYLDRRGRSIALQNLESAFGETMPPRLRRDTARQSYQNFAVTMLSLFWSPRVTEDNAGEYLEMTGFEEALQRARLEGRGCVFVCAHQGNWEWGALAFSLLGGWANIVAEDFKNQALTDLFVRLRGRNRHRVIPQDKSVLRMLKAVLRGENTGLLGDLNLDPSKAAVVLEAFSDGNAGLEMCATRLHSVLAKRGKALLVPVLTLPLPRGRCRVMAQEPIHTDSLSEKEISQRTWDVFESFIKQRPELWLWAYKHFRYRPRSVCRKYPAYAIPEDSFEAIRGEV